MIPIPFYVPQNNKTCGLSQIKTVITENSGSHAIKKSLDCGGNAIAPFPEIAESDKFATVEVWFHISFVIRIESELVSIKSKG
jgi:hypothetical protein